MSTISSRVLVLGATGGMGRRIAELWRTEFPTARLRLGIHQSRDLGDLGVGPGVETVPCSLEDLANVRRAVAGANAVINAVGPYVYAPEPLLDVCAAEGAHYVDLASEPAFLARVRSWARRPGLDVGVCPGASTIPGLVMVTIDHLTGQLSSAPASFDVFLSMGSANPLSTGLLASMTLPLGMPLGPHDGVRAFRKLRRHRLQTLGERLFGRYPGAFDEEVPASPRRGVPIRLWVGLDRPWIAHALRVVGYLRPYFSERAWLALVRKVRPVAGVVSTVGRQAGAMRIEALDAEGRLAAGVEYLAARNGLIVPALPPIWAARALLEKAASSSHALQDLVTFEETVHSLRAHGLEVIAAPGREPLLAPPP